MPKTRLLQLRARSINAAYSSKQRRYEELVEKYRDGTPKEGYMDPSGTDDQFQARILHGWMNGRDIPVDELAILFNQSEGTIKRWLAMKDKL